VHAGAPAGFDVARLHQLLVARLERGGGGEERDAAAARAEEALERLMVSRVFGFEGLAEAVGEVERSFERVEIPDSEDDEEEETVEGRGIGLVVIDNFAAAVQWTKRAGYQACELPPVPAAKAHGARSAAGRPRLPAVTRQPDARAQPRLRHRLRREHRRRLGPPARRRCRGGAA
jgi:hypothetical protein